MYGMVFTPYSNTMKAVLQEELGGKGGMTFEVDTNGVSGQLVTEQAGFRERMGAVCR